MAAWDDWCRGDAQQCVLVSLRAVQRYDKVNLATFGPFEEGLYFSAGTARRTMDVEGHRIGVVICYDLFFPQLSMDYALGGAEAIVCISASPFTSREYFETLLPARAIETTAYVAYQNQVGTQLNEVFFGGGEARGPRGELLAKNRYFEEDLNTFELTSEIVASARRGGRPSRTAFPAVVEHLCATARAGVSPVAPRP